MLFIGLLSLDLPSRLGPPLSTRCLEGVENLLFRGRLKTRRAECRLSAGAVLAGCYGVLRQLGAQQLLIRQDADEALDLRVRCERYGEAPPPWPELLPAPWCEQPSAFVLRARLRTAGTAAALRLRYAPRHEPEHGALRGSLRLIWDLAPHAGREERFPQDLLASLSGSQDLRRLERRLRQQGQDLLETLVASLEAAFEGASGASFAQVRVLSGYGAQPQRFVELLEDLPLRACAQLPLLEERLARDPAHWPALDAQGVPGRLHSGRFTPVAEVLDVC